MRYMTGRTEMTRTDPNNASNIVCIVGWDLINEWDSTGPVWPGPSVTAYEGGYHLSGPHFHYSLLTFQTFSISCLLFYKLEYWYSFLL